MRVLAEIILPVVKRIDAGRMLGRSVAHLTLVAFLMLLVGCMAKTYFQAAREGDLKTVEARLAEGVPINQRSSNGDTALMHAAANGQIEIVKFLIEKGADVNARMTAFRLKDGHCKKATDGFYYEYEIKKTNDGRTALFLAVENGHTEVAEILIANGADPSARCVWKNMDAGFQVLPEISFGTLLRGGTLETVYSRDTGKPIRLEWKRLYVSESSAEAGYIRCYGIRSNVAPAKEEEMTVLGVAAKLGRTAILPLLISYDQEILSYNRAIEINPGDAGVYNDRGVVYVEKGLYDQAISDFNKALEINPRDAGAYNDRGIAYGQKRLYDQAISDFSKAIEMGFREQWNVKPG